MLNEFTCLGHCATAQSPLPSDRSRSGPTRSGEMAAVGMHLITTKWGHGGSMSVPNYVVLIELLSRTATGYPIPTSVRSIDPESVFESVIFPVLLTFHHPRCRVPATSKWWGHVDMLRQRTDVRRDSSAIDCRAKRKIMGQEYVAGM